MKVSIVIVNHNTPVLTERCVHSLKRNLAQITYEVIIVNNGGQNYSLRRSTHGKFRVYNLDHNPGFGASNNFGARHARGDILWFLNSDAMIIDDSIKQTFNFLKINRRVGIVSPMLYLDTAGRKLQKDFSARRQTLGTLLLRQARPILNLQHGEFAQSDVVAGASMVLRRAVFDALGGFDEKIFMYLEDDDLCYRAQKAGYRVGVYTKARAVHLQGQSIKSNKRRKRLYYQSQNYFWRKHYGVAMMWLMRALRWPLKFAKTI